MAPPIRLKMSDSTVGSAEWSAAEPVGPTWSRTGEFVVPASKSRPAIRTPFTSAVDIAVTPLSASSVARPMPRTTVSGRVIRIVSVRW